MDRDGGDHAAVSAALFGCGIDLDKQKKIMFMALSAAASSLIVVIMVITPP